MRPAPKDPEFRHRAVELARLREKPIEQIAEDLGVAESGLRRWVAQAAIDEGKREGLSSGERAELVRLRRQNRAQAVKIEILKRASPYFARGTWSQTRVGLVRELAADGFPEAPGCGRLDLGLLRAVDPATVEA